MLNILERIIDGQGKMDDLATLKRPAKHVQTASLCGLGQTVPNPVLSTLRYFRDDYETAIMKPPKKKRKKVVAPV